MSLYIGIDSGTQSTRLLVVDIDARRVVMQAAVKHAFVPGLPPGHIEQHPQEWWTALEKLLGMAATTIEIGRVRGIGVSAQQHGFVALDAHDEVIRPAKLWCDTSTTRECALLTRRLGGAKEVIRRIGLPFLTGYTAPKILWLKRNEPAHYKRLRRVLLPHDYLNYCLTGAHTMECGDASGTALMNVRSLFKWDQAAFDAAVASVPHGAEGLKLTPYLDGERTPNLPHATGTLHGITRRNLTPAHLARAAVEGVTGGLNFGLSRLRKLGMNPKEIRVTGGGARSAVWRQLMADIFDVPVVKLVNEECAALGAALQSLWCERRREGHRVSISNIIRSSGIMALDEASRCVPQ